MRECDVTSLIKWGINLAATFSPVSPREIPEHVEIFEGRIYNQLRGFHLENSFFFTLRTVVQSQITSFFYLNNHMPIKNSFRLVISQMSFLGNIFAEETSENIEI